MAVDRKPPSDWSTLLAIFKAGIPIHFRDDKESDLTPRKPQRRCLTTFRSRLFTLCYSIFPLPISLRYDWFQHASRYEYLPPRGHLIDSGRGRVFSVLQTAHCGSFTWSAVIAQDHQSAARQILLFAVLSLCSTILTLQRNTRLCYQNTLSSSSIAVPTSLIVVREYCRDFVSPVDEKTLLLLFLDNRIFPPDTSLCGKRVLRFKWYGIAFNTFLR